MYSVNPEAGLETIFKKGQRGLLQGREEGKLFDDI